MLELLDTHQHLIYHAKIGYDWTADIPVLARRDFSLADYHSLTAGKGVGGTLFMETGVNDEDYQAETRLVAELAKDPASGILGIIASVRPETSDGFEQWLEESSDLGVVGYRRIFHVVDDTVSQAESFRRNVRRIGDAGKVFDTHFIARQLRIAVEFVKACDNTSLVLNHCGVPDIAGGDFGQWRNDMKELATFPNVTCKLSGVMAYCAPGQSSLEAITPYVDHVLETFGPERMVWGSDWPVVDTAHGLPTWIDVTREILARLSDDEARKIAYANVENVYGVKLAPR